MTGVDTIGGNYTPYANQYKQQNTVPQTTSVVPSLATDTFVRENGDVANSVGTNRNSTAQYKKKSHPIRKTIAWILLIGGAAAGVAMHAGGGIKNAIKNKEVISTTKNGFNKIWSNITGKAEKTTITNNDNIIPETNKGIFTVTQNGTTKTCQIPGKHNISSGVRAQGTIEQQARKIGATTYSSTVPGNAKVKTYSFTYKNCFGLNKYKVTVKNGKVLSIKNSRNKSVTLGKSAMDDIAKSIENVKKGDTQKLLDYTVQTYKVTENGVSSQFKRQGSGYKLTSFISDNFALDSDEAIAYAAQNPEAKSLIDAVKRGQSGLNLISGDVHCRLGTVKVENGEIAGIIENKIYYPNTDAHFIALKEKNQQLFQDILDNKYRYRKATYGV